MRKKLRVERFSIKPRTQPQRKTHVLRTVISDSIVTQHSSNLVCCGVYLIISLFVPFRRGSAHCLVTSRNRDAAKENVCRHIIFVTARACLQRPLTMLRVTIYLPACVVSTGICFSPSQIITLVYKRKLSMKC